MSTQLSTANAMSLEKELTWFIFPSNLPHLPGKGVEDQKRYSLSADLYA